MAVALTVVLAGCGTSRETTKLDVESLMGSEMAYKERVLANKQVATAVTAKIRAKVSAGDRDVSLGGSLKMLRDDVIQIQLTFLGFEVGRLEFTVDDVLVIDRVNKQYARVPYTMVDFLQTADLDFYALQSLLWNELFVPGSRDVSRELSQFSVASSGEHTLLSLRSAPELEYAFLTQTETALLDRTIINSKDRAVTDNLVCIYSDFKELDGHQFPGQVSLRFQSDETYTLDLELSNLNNKDDWQRRTKVSSKYSLMDVNRFLERLTDQ